MTKYFRASLYSLSAGVKQHGIMKIEGDKVTMLPQTFTVKSECNAAVTELNNKETT